MAGLSVTSPFDPVLSVTVPWVGGRFYNAFTGNGGVSGTVALALTLVAVPFLVPHSTTVTSIGIEITGAAAAGATYRMALYHSDSYGLPGDLILDAGTVAIDSTGFKSSSISQVIPAGIVWTAGAASNTGASSRALSGVAFHFAQVADTIDLTLTGYNQVVFNSFGAGINAQGFPASFYQIGQNTTIFALALAASPRIMLGV